MSERWYWRLEVSFPLTHQGPRFPDKIRAAVGIKDTDSGMGMGMYDMGWVFEEHDGEDERRAKEALDRVLSAGLPDISANVVSLQAVE